MKKLFTVLLTITMLLSLWGCQAGPEKPLYGLILTADESFSEKIQEGFQTAAEELGVEVIVKYAATVDAQISAIEELRKQSVKAIAVDPAATTGLRDALRNAANTGITVATINADTEGSPLFINQADTARFAEVLLDGMLELTGGEGKFAVIAGNRFSGMNMWVAALEHLAKDEKYKDITWVDTVYCDPENAEEIKQSTEALLREYPDLEAICCPDVYILQHCCQKLQDSNASVKATGISTPSAMKDLVGDDKVCPFFYLWNPVELGYCAAYILDAGVDGKIGEAGSKFTADNDCTYGVSSDFLADKTILVGPPFCYTEDNVAKWADVF